MWRCRGAGDMLNTALWWVGLLTVIGATLHFLGWGLLFVVDRGVRMSGLVLVITAWARQHRPGIYRIVVRGMFARGKQPPQQRPS